MANDRDPEPFSADQARRRRRHTILMAMHVIGFALAGVLYYQAWWLGLVLIIITTPLPWVAVILANSPSRPFRSAFPEVAQARRTCPPSPRAPCHRLPIGAAQPGQSPDQRR